MKVKASHTVRSDSLWFHGLQPVLLLCPWNSPGKSTEVGCHFLFQGIILTRRSNPGLPHYRQILYQLNHCSVQFSHSVVSNSLRPHELQHARPPCPSPTARVYPNPWPLSWWCHPTISSSAIPFSSYPQSFPASGSFPWVQLFISGDQSSASASVLLLNIQDLFPFELTSLISLQPKGLSRVSSTTIWKHQFFSTQPSLRANSHIHTWLLEKP